MTDSSSALALEYFHIGNGIVAFHVAQTILFLNAIYKAPLLREALTRKRVFGHVFTWLFAAIYAGVIAGCGVNEYWLRLASGEPAQVITSTVFAACGRVGVAVVMAVACSLIIACLRAAEAAPSR